MALTTDVGPAPTAPAGPGQNEGTHAGRVVRCCSVAERGDKLLDERHVIPQRRLPDAAVLTHPGAELPHQGQHGLGRAPR